ARIGNCTFRGVVPPTAIMRYALIDFAGWLTVFSPDWLATGQGLVTFVRQGERLREMLHAIFEVPLPGVEVVDGRGRSVDKGWMPPPPPKVGRNDPCPCGSGKKFKRCCL